jgi:hypothetical protein
LNRTEWCWPHERHSARRLDSRDPGRFGLVAPVWEGNAQKPTQIAPVRVTHNSYDARTPGWAGLFSFHLLNLESNTSPVGHLRPLRRRQRRAKVQIRRMYKCADLSFVHLGKVVEGAQSLSALDVMRDVVVGSNFVGWQIGYSSLQSSGMGEPPASVCGFNLDGCSTQTCSAISMNRHKSETRGT